MNDDSGLQRFEMRMYGDSRLTTVETRPSDCPHCLFVHRHVKKTGHGDVSFVCRGSYHTDIRRVEVVWMLGVLGLICRGVTVEEVEAELAEKRGDS